VRLLAICALFVAGTATAQPLACPAGTVARSTRGDTIEDWCERADRTRHGPYRSAWAPAGKVRQTAGTYSHGLQDGAWQTWRPDGTPWEQTYYRDGKKHGPWLVRHANGRIEVDGEHVADEQHGAWTWWYANGKRQASSAYVHGREHGASTEWDEDGAVTSQGSYHFGDRIGPWLETDWFHTARGRYCKGERCGRWEVFEDGRLESAGEFRDGRRHGTWSSWLDGELRVRGPYLRGTKHGRWTWWDEDGDLHAQIECRAGEPHGQRREWWEPGKPKLDARYADGRLHGEQLWIDEDGRRRSAHYERGELVRGDPIEPDDGAGLEADGAGGRSRCEPEPFMGADLGE
jgi:antitoxin component YwqK of YwqJK toxin-antitoxin module